MDKPYSLIIFQNKTLNTQIVLLKITNTGSSSMIKEKKKLLLLLNMNYLSIHLPLEQFSSLKEHIPWKLKVKL